MTGLVWDTGCRDVLEELSDKRNKIVHENIHINLSADELTNLSDGLERSLILLGKKIKELNVIVIDDGGFLD